jgi:hypothetical protein
MVHQIGRSDNTAASTESPRNGTSFSGRFIQNVVNLGLEPVTNPNAITDFMFYLTGRRFVEENVLPPNNSASVHQSVGDLNNQNHREVTATIPKPDEQPANQSSIKPTEPSTNNLFSDQSPTLSTSHTHDDTTQQNPGGEDLIINESIDDRDDIISPSSDELQRRRNNAHFFDNYVLPNMEQVRASFRDGDVHAWKNPLRYPMGDICFTCSEDPDIEWARQNAKTALIRKRWKCLGIIVCTAPSCRYRIRPKIPDGVMALMPPKGKSRKLKTRINVHSTQEQVMIESSATQRGGLSTIRLVASPFITKVHTIIPPHLHVRHPLKGKKWSVT